MHLLPFLLGVVYELKPLPLLTIYCEFQHMQLSEHLGCIEVNYRYISRIFYNNSSCSDMSIFSSKTTFFDQE